MTPLSYFALGILACGLVKCAYLIAESLLNKRQEKKFIRVVRFVSKDDEPIGFISVDSSDRAALRNLEAQLREQFDLPNDAHILRDMVKTARMRS